MWINVKYHYSIEKVFKKELTKVDILIRVKYIEIEELG
jgi:hypothetical protein